MIKKTAKGYVLYSKDGFRTLGGPYRPEKGRSAWSARCSSSSTRRGEPAR